MSEHEHNQVNGSGDKPLDRDLNLKGILLFSLGIVLLMVVATAAMYFFTVEVSDRDKARDAPPTPILQEAIDEGVPLVPPDPRLQPQPRATTGLVDRGISPDRETAPNEEMRRFLAEEEQDLASYGWVDEGNGIARIPIDRAMELIVEQGLPETTPQPTADNAGEEGSDG
ncbi:MAG: hypothetical protein EP299_10665 [Acidobacteria bacterium]|nr:MAG: hypothetical protein EP299_10665 [Acidobacteriota bacterium]